ncbi:hypothetical protein [Gordonia jinhuaensis]|nr:hypothetical protein [Gordonia jinhuaensis]
MLSAVRWGLVGVAEARMGCGESRMSRAAMSLVAAAVAFAGSTSCATEVSGSSAAPAAGVSAYRERIQASESLDAARAATVAFCARSIESARTSLDSYNRFIAKLNAVQEYSRLGGADIAAATTFDNGVAAMRSALGSSVDPDVVQRGQELIVASTTVSATIRAKNTRRVNADIDAWIRARDTLVVACQSAVPVAEGADAGGPGTEMSTSEPSPTTPSR